MTTTQTTTATSSGNNAQLRLDASIEDALADYKIHHSSQRPLSSNQQQDGERNTVIINGDIPREAQPSDFDPTLAPHPPVPYPVSNPDWWTDDFRSVPDYRPINPHLDLNERRQRLLYTVVGQIMVRGCSLMAVWAQLWRNTAGKFTDIGLSKVGGEW